VEGAEVGKFDIEDEDDSHDQAHRGYASFPIANKLSLYGKLGFLMWEADAPDLAALTAPT
jgi:hypothetical protein